MKRPFSLLEVCIGLALTAILLTTLFSSFRQLMTTGAFVAQVRQKEHSCFVFQLRMLQLFDSLPEKTLFYTDNHENATGLALYFTAHNGADPDPNFRTDVDACLYRTKENDLVLQCKSQRTETFFTKVDLFRTEFYNPKENEWEPAWKKDILPPLVRFQIDGKAYTFVLPKASHEALYK